MKLTLETEGGTYTADVQGVATLGAAIDIVERLLIAAGYGLEPGSLDVSDKHFAEGTNGKVVQKKPRAGATKHIL